MTSGARSGLDELYESFGGQVRFVTVYVREAHPGERYPHHESEERKWRHARDWVREDGTRWTVAVDGVGGETHQAYGALPNPLYLVGRDGRVAFRALWAGQKRLIENKLEELLEREYDGETGVNLGEQRNLVIPLIHGAAEFESTIERAGEKAKQDFRREMGNVVYGLQKMVSKIGSIGEGREKKGRSHAT